MTCSTIIPTSVQNEHLLYLTRVSVRSHQATCDSQLHVVAHHCMSTPEQVGLTQTLKREVVALGGVFHYWTEPFSLSKYFNRFTDLTTTDLLCYASADILYFPGWLDAIRDAWKDRPHLHSMSPFSFEMSLAEGPTYSRTGKLEKVVHGLTQPVIHSTVFKRSSCYRWDERFAFHELDTDYFRYLENSNQLAGVCRYSRVDHFLNGVRKNVSPGWVSDTHFTDSSEALLKKWSSTEHIQ